MVIVNEFFGELLEFRILQRIHGNCFSPVNTVLYCFIATFIVQPASTEAAWVA